MFLLVTALLLWLLSSRLMMTLQDASPLHCWPNNLYFGVLSKYCNLMYYMCILVAILMNYDTIWAHGQGKKIKQFSCRITNKLSTPSASSFLSASFKFPGCSTYGSKFNCRTFLLWAGSDWSKCSKFSWQHLTPVTSRSNGCLSFSLWFNLCYWIHDWFYTEQHIFFV